MPETFDVVVIGSGFGGSIAACRLAQAGRSVLVLERGRRWARTDFARSPTEVADGAFWSPEKGQFGILDMRDYGAMKVIQGSGVGGGSLHYFNVHIRPPASIFENDRWPANIDLHALDPYYRLAKDMLDAEPFTPPTGRSVPTRTAAFHEACLNVERVPEAVDIAVYTGDGRFNRHGGTPQLPCDYTGACGLGCATHAKNTLDLNYLALAEQHGADVRPLHQVERITPRRGGTYRVDAVTLIDGDPEPGPTVSFFAKTVIVAAGTLGSNELLLRCRDIEATLPKLSPTLGHGFSGNGDFLFAGASTKQDIDASRGPSITSGVDFASADQEVYVEDLGVPEVLAWFVEGMLANVNPLANVLRWLHLAVADRLRIRGATERLARERSHLLRGSLTRTFLPFLGMCEDAADGQIKLTRGELDLVWDVSASRANIEEMIAAMRELAEGLGATYVQSPLWDNGEELLTAHPLGGCAMAPDASRGVVDEYGAVHGYPGLYVMDGSTVPTALARNPTATISALAERAVFHLLHGRELELGDALTPSNVPAGRSPRAEDLGLAGLFGATA